MNKPMLTGVVLGVAVATAGGVLAGYKLLNEDKQPPATAAAVYTERCTEETVTTSPDPKDQHRIAGTVIGGLIGGAVGKDVGHRDITTAAGAAGGAIAGNQIQKKIQERNATTTTETHCVPVQR
ncbi:MAG TPA: glycine zipper domain-containing protein [Gammaproteobacteria bacterium]|nr:glycine zipper domain-containing protein [Gammaproteobacteria bacterium]